MNTNRPNKFAAKCSTCAVKVAAGEGTLGAKVAGRWTTYCPGHTPAAPAARPSRRSTYSTYRTTDGGTVTYSDDTDDAYDAMKDGFIY